MGSVAEGTKFSPSYWVGEPGTFPFGSASDLNNIGAFYPTVANREGILDPLDDERIGARRPVLLLGRELSTGDLDPAMVFEAVAELGELQSEILENPGLHNDPEIRAQGEAIVERLELFASVYPLGDDVMEGVDQLAKDIGM